MDSDKKLGVGNILVVYFALKPIYLWASGGMQLCDFFLVLASVYIFVKRQGRFVASKSVARTWYLFLGLCIYQIVVNAIWTAILGENLLKSSLYYLFNFVAFSLCLVVCSDIGIKKTKRAIAYGCLISLAITAVGLLMVGAGGRRLGFFNNPNQLGYYALLVFSFILLCSKDIKRWIWILVIILSGWSIIASGSKAAFLAAIVMFAAHLIYNNRGKSVKSTLIQLTAVLLFGLGIYLFFFSQNKYLMSNPTLVFMRYRILQMATENDTALGTGRGYNRLFEVGANILWGMGEGAYERFDVMTGMEAHSSYITLLVCYGIIGFIGYCKLFVNCIRSKEYFIRNMIIMGGTLFYGVAHNGLRNTLMWILLAVLLYEGSRQIKNERASLSLYRKSDNSN